MNRINIKDLANLLSLNPSTVSRALSNHPDISVETIARVKAAASEFNYLPNLRAKYFRKKSSGLIAVILPEFNMFFIPELMNGINSVIQNSEFSIILFFSNDHFLEEKEIINHCLSWAVDGILISLAEDTKNCDHLQIIKSAKIPLVLMDKVIFSNDFSTITIDDEQAAFNGTNILIKQNKKFILGVFGNPDLQITKLRLRGFINACKANNILFDTINIQTKDNNLINKLEGQLISNQYDGIFTMSDETLSLTYPILLRLKLFPNQITLAAISGGILPSQIYPYLSYIHHSGIEMGKKAMKTLLDIQNNNSTTQHHQLETNVVQH